MTTTQMLEIAKREAIHTKRTKKLQGELKMRNRPQEVAPFWVLWTYVAIYQSHGIEWSVA